VSLNISLIHIRWLIIWRILLLVMHHVGMLLMWRYGLSLLRHHSIHIHLLMIHIYDCILLGSITKFKINLIKIISSCIFFLDLNFIFIQKRNCCFEVIIIIIIQLNKVFRLSILIKVYYCFSKNNLFLELKTRDATGKVMIKKVSKHLNNVITKYIKLYCNIFYHSLLL